MTFVDNKATDDPGKVDCKLLLEQNSKVRIRHHNNRYNELPRTVVARTNMRIATRSIGKFRGRPFGRR